MIVDPPRAPSRVTPPRAAASRPGGWEIGLFAAALAVAGLVALTLLFAGDATYSEIALAPGRPPTTFQTVSTPPGTSTLGRRTMSAAELGELHRGWAAYVTGRAGQQPPRLANGDYFTSQERAHMADVRSVFVAAQVAAVVAALLLAWLALRAWRGGALARLVRAAALLVLVVVAVIGLLAALAFDAAFLLFHQIFFPQGNFLFEPGSNLLALYPQDYFYGVTLRIGATFVLAALVLAAVAHRALALRSRVPVDSRA